MNKVIALQNYKFVLLKKKQMLVLKKKIKGNTCNNSTKKERKVNLSSQLGKMLRVLVRHWARSGLFSEPSITLSIPRPSSFTIPPSVPGAGTAFSGA